MKNDRTMTLMTKLSYIHVENINKVSIWSLHNLQGRKADQKEKACKAWKSIWSGLKVNKHLGIWTSWKLEFRKLPENIHPWISASFISVGSTDVHQRYRTSYTTHVMALSPMGPNLGVFWFLLTTHAKANAKQMRSRSSRAARLLTRDCLHAQTAVHAGN